MTINNNNKIREKEGKRKLSMSFNIQMIHQKMKKNVYLVKNHHQKDINIKHYLNKYLKKKQKIIRI